MPLSFRKGEYELGGKGERRRKSPHFPLTPVARPGQAVCLSAPGYTVHSLVSSSFETELPELRPFPWGCHDSMGRY